MHGMTSIIYGQAESLFILEKTENGFQELVLVDSFAAFASAQILELMRKKKQVNRSGS